MDNASATASPSSSNASEPSQASERLEHEGAEADPRQRPEPPRDERERKRHVHADRDDHPRSERHDELCDLGTRLVTVRVPENASDQVGADERENTDRRADDGERDPRGGDHVTRARRRVEADARERNRGDEPDREGGHADERGRGEVGVAEARHGTGTEPAGERHGDDVGELERERDRGGCDEQREAVAQRVSRRSSRPRPASMSGALAGRAPRTERGARSTR